MPILTQPVHESNDCHVPAGSPAGGQFCSADSPFEDRQRAFTTDLLDLGYVNPFNEREIVLRDEAGVEVYAVKDGIRVSAVRAFVPRHGAGGRAMQDILRLADKYQLPLFATASPFMKGRMTKAQLLTWYKSMGFKAKGSDITRMPR